MFDRFEHGSREAFQSFVQARVAGFKVILNTFPQTYPGLIHFIHVNRATNQITAPTLADEQGSPFMAVFWKFVSKCRKVLRRGTTLAVWKDESFTFSYSLSFENRQYLDRSGPDRAPVSFTSKPNHHVSATLLPHSHFFIRK